jgi:hypothetical protein
MTLRLNGSTSGYAEIDAPAVAGSNTLVLPASNGSANQLLKNSTAAGTLSFATVTENSSGDLAFNSGYGSVATAYGCRAWVNFDGTGTVAIRASGNVSSITDNGTGDYTVNFTTAMPDANYAAIVAGARGTSNDDFRSGNRQGGTYSTTAVQVFSGVASSGGTYVDANPLNVAVFR